MEHDVRSEFGDDASQRVPVADIEAMQPRFLGHVMRRAGGQVVNHADVVTVGEEAVDQMGSDEACPTGHKGAQGFVPFPSVSSASTFLSTLRASSCGA